MSMKTEIQKIGCCFNCRYTNCGFYLIMDDFPDDSLYGQDFCRKYNRWVRPDNFCVKWRWNEKENM